MIFRSRHVWTPEELQILADRFPHENSESLADELGVSVHMLNKKAGHLGLSKSKTYMKSVKTALVDAVKASHKAGTRQKPKTWKPVGSIRYTKLGQLEVKLCEPKVRGGSHGFVLVHHLVWELHYGPIPPQHHVTFKDRNVENITPENLELVSYAERMARNSILNLPQELVEVVRLKAALTRTITNRTKKRHG